MLARPHLALAIAVLSLCMQLLTASGALAGAKPGHCSSMQAITAAEAVHDCSSATDHAGGHQSTTASHDCSAIFCEAACVSIALAAPVALHQMQAPLSDLLSTPVPRLIVAHHPEDLLRPPQTAS